MAALGAGRRPFEPSLLEQVLAPQVLGSLDRVRLRVGHASGDRPGHTRVRGRDDASGTELERHVTYTPGDDLRRVDWNVYARLGELLTRRFVAEREVPVWILIDTSASMGPRESRSKLDLACAVAAVLGAVSLAGGDRLSFVAVPGNVRAAGQAGHTVGPLRSRRDLARLRQFLTELQPAPGEGDLVAGLEKATRLVRRGLIVLISDFLFERSILDGILAVIARRRCEGKLVQVLSREDIDPSWLRGQHRLIDRETGEDYEIDPSVATWQRYRETLDAHCDDVRRAALARGMSSVVTVTDVGLERFVATELPRLGLSLVR
jgi:uncharacterized protein (DUF58 family)